MKCWCEQVTERCEKCLAAEAWEKLTPMEMAIVKKFSEELDTCTPGNYAQVYERLENNNNAVSYWMNYGF